MKFKFLFVSSLILVLYFVGLGSAKAGNPSVFSNHTDTINMSKTVDPSQVTLSCEVYMDLLTKGTKTSFSRKDLENFFHMLLYCIHSYEKKGNLSGLIITYDWRVTEEFAKPVNTASCEVNSALISDLTNYFWPTFGHLPTCKLISNNDPENDLWDCEDLFPSLQPHLRNIIGVFLKVAIQISKENPNDPLLLNFDKVVTKEHSDCFCENGTLDIGEECDGNLYKNNPNKNGPSVGFQCKSCNVVPISIDRSPILQLPKQAYPIPLNNLLPLMDKTKTNDRGTN